MNNQVDTDKQQNSMDQEISYRVIELGSILRGLAIYITKYLIAANSGGIVAVLAYLNTQETIYGVDKIRLSLFSFILGLILVSITLIIFYYKAWNIKENYLIDRTLFYSNDISINELRRRDNERCKSDKLEYILGAGSFLFFFIGIISGVLNFI